MTQLSHLWNDKVCVKTIENESSGPFTHEVGVLFGFVRPI